MDFQFWLTFSFFIGLIIVLVFDLIRPVFAFAFVSFALMVFDVINVEQFISSFANKSILTIFLLIFVAQVIRDNFKIAEWLDEIFRETKNPRWFVFKKSLSVSALSSIMNNTPIVAMLIPYSMHWSKKNNVSVSKVLLPISFAAITGGMITVIGTSTNLVLNGFLEANNLPPLESADYFVPGVLVSIGVAIFSATIGFSLLPNKKSVIIDEAEFQKDYLVECSLVDSHEQKGCTVESLGLRNLNDVFLVEVIRGKQLISPVQPKTELEIGDRLFFAGDKEAAIKFIAENELLDWSKTKKFNISKENEIIEAVVPYNSGLANSTLRNFDFRLNFDSAVIGIHRNGEKIKGKLGSIVLRPGDLLIIVAGDDFDKLMRNQRDLYLISGVKGLFPQIQKNSKNKTLFVLGAIFMLLLFALNVLSFFTALIGILGMAIVNKLTDANKIKKEFNFELLIILGSAITLGLALTQVGVGEVIMRELAKVDHDINKYVLVAVLAGLTVALTNFVTNIAAISIMFPLVNSLSPIIDIPISNLFLIIAFSASAAFITPIGYQTNIMVMGPGGYKSIDYLKFGIPVTLIYFAILIAYLKFI